MGYFTENKQIGGYMYSKTEAAYLILKEYKKPLPAKEIIRIALEKKMIQTEGKTPWSTLGADLYSENKRKVRRNEALRFLHIGEGIWGLTEWELTPAEIEVAKPKSKKRKPKT